MPLAPSLRCNPRRAHHIKHTRSEAEQEKYGEPPRRNAEPAVDEPTEAGSDDNGSNKFTRTSETTRVAGCSRRPIHTRTIGRSVFTFGACKLFAELLGSRGESGTTVAVLAGAAGHDFPHSQIGVRGMSASLGRADQ